jgi:hypothetical protein
MMTAAAARASYARGLARAGEQVTLQKGDDEHVCLARVTGYDPEELVGDIEQGDRRIILLADALPFEPAEDDRILVRGTPLNIEDVDDSTRRINGELIAYEIRARG